MNPTQPEQDRAGHENACPWSLALGTVANVLAIAAGTVFLFAESGSIFHGTERQSVAFICLGGVSVVVGLLLVLPVALHELYRGVEVGKSCLGVLLALTPYPVAMIVSRLIGEILGLTFES